MICAEVSLSMRRVTSPALYARCNAVILYPSAPELPRTILIALIEIYSRFLPNASRLPNRINSITLMSWATKGSTVLFFIGSGETLIYLKGRVGVEEDFAGDFINALCSIVQVTSPKQQPFRKTNEET